MLFHIVRTSGDQHPFQQHSKPLQQQHCKSIHTTSHHQQATTMQTKTIIQLALALFTAMPALANPMSPEKAGILSPFSIFKRQDCECAVCDVGPGDCSGSDLDDYNACVAVTQGTCGRSCGDLEPGTGAQDGCYLADITRQKPCENECVQRQLRAKYCETDPDWEYC